MWVVMEDAMTDAERLAYEKGQREMRERAAMLACINCGCEAAIRSLSITSTDQEKPRES
jgi:hypothetical protein